MKKINILILAVFALLLNSCKEPAVIEEATIDAEFNALFSPDSGGVTGADGTISVALPDGKSWFMMGDSFLGTVTDNVRSDETFMMNNSFVEISADQKSATALYNGTYDQPASYIVPPNHDIDSTWYWPGHGFVKDSIFHLFMSKFNHPGEGQWGFAFMNTDYLRYSWPQMELLSNERFPFTDINKVHWGHAVLNDGEYVYIYGSRVEDTTGIFGMAKAHVMRAKINSAKTLEDFEFFNGTSWTSDPEASMGMEGISTNVSEQFTIFAYENKYVMINHERGIGTTDIFSFVADNPQGPWYNKQLLYQTTEHSKDKRIFSYNAMAHPQYIKDGKLLICYNINSLEVPLVFEDARNYRPQFLRVDMNKIMP